MVTSGDIYFCDSCWTYLRYESHCESCNAPAAKLGWMVSNDSEV
jgi:hypothetical protein